MVQKIRRGNVMGVKQKIHKRRLMIVYQNQEHIAYIKVYRKEE